MLRSLLLTQPGRVISSFWKVSLSVDIISKKRGTTGAGTSAFTWRLVWLPFPNNSEQITISPRRRQECFVFPMGQTAWSFSFRNPDEPPDRKSSYFKGYLPASPVRRENFLSLHVRNKHSVNVWKDVQICIYVSLLIEPKYSSYYDTSLFD